MKYLKIALCIAIWTFLGWLCLSKVTQRTYDEDVIYLMSQSTYDEIVDTLTSRNQGIEPSEHQIVTYYYERFQK